MVLRSCGGRRKPYLLERGHGDRPQAQDLDLDNGGMVGVMEWSLLCPGAMDSFSREALSSSSTRMYKQHPRTDPAENPWCHLRANLSSFPFDFTGAQNLKKMKRRSKIGKEIIAAEKVVLGILKTVKNPRSAVLKTSMMAIHASQS
ncbi:uncharacterized protein [Triticum aestivum]|uniref:uncharacterized protein isoform X2 n=1 Tax=Triticum aestivum TaxID=4565 RepID=UPI001D026C62|nr:uncharacterized protein LOC123093505 isoform X2 [Triticum aestivum]